MSNRGAVCKTFRDVPVRNATKTPPSVCTEPPLYEKGPFSSREFQSEFQRFPTSGIPALGIPGNYSTALQVLYSTANLFGSRFQCRQVIGSWGTSMRGSLQCRNRRRNDLSPVSKLFHEQFPGVEVLCFLPSTHYPLHDFDLRAAHARTFLPAALASVSFGFVLVRVRVQ